MLRITIEAGGIYDMRERPYQVIVYVDGRPPKVFSHDYELAKAFNEVISYIRSLEDSYRTNKP